MGSLGWRRYWAVWAGAIPLLLWAFVRLLGLDSGFPLVPLLAYTPYAAAAALLVTGVATALRNWGAALVAGLAAVALFAVVLPRAVGEPEAIPRGDAELRILSANIHHGTAHATALVGLVRRLHPDLLFVQELTPSFVRRLDAAGIFRYLPHGLVEAMSPGARGSGVYMRLPVRPLPGPPPTVTFFKMLHLEVRLGGGRVVRMVDVHPPAPTRCCIAAWSAGLESLPHADQPGPPWILAGDFNSTLDFSKLRDLIGTGYRDAGDATGRGLEATWPQGRVLPPPVTIDHVLAGPGIAIAGYEVLALPGSDHRAIFARLGVP